MELEAKSTYKSYEAETRDLIPKIDAAQKLHWPAPLNVHLSIPVKAFIVEDKMVPSYGRGKKSTDPKLNGIETQNSYTPNRNAFPHNGFAFMGGFQVFSPMTTARFGNFTLSTAFGVLSHHCSTFKLMDF
ncbi:hypothetical protein H5410_006359 [Solanum commersonii]|uniref:Uncharacterized protein n=1 Tax=Solanum commersonii TaxID=4109 RepID=A0A9J6A949_SOLCO|nr:hypothetical protein H5410_006359 [Solanum commersonii]